MLNVEAEIKLGGADYGLPPKTIPFLELLASSLSDFT
jgi:hypothetical protein